MHALILDRTHHVLVAGGRLPEVPVDGPRPMKTVATALAARGVALPAPAGSRPCATGGRDFAFVIDRAPAPEGLAWVPLREVSADDTLWRIYVELMLGGHEPPTRKVDVWAFGDRPEMAAQLLHVVTCGAKRATMGWVEAARREGLPLPYLGGVSVVTDGFGYPHCVLRSVAVREVAFRDIEPAWAAAEAEGDLTYEDWRESHEAYFTSEAARLGLSFDEHSVISVEHFEVLHVVGRADR